jgi:hypothetical protein
LLAGFFSHDFLARFVVVVHTTTIIWLEICVEIAGKTTTGGGDPTDQAHDGGIGMLGDVAFLHRLADRHRQQPLQSPWPRT